jgi:uncharacterized membrane protein (UPF0127 family)
MKRPDAIHLVLILAAIVAGGYLIASGCNDTGVPGPPPVRRGPATPPSAAPTVQMRIGSGTFNLELARTVAETRRGLMHRDSMPPDHGMIFIFDRERTVGFWMKNTKIPLDIIYVDAGGRVVSTHKMHPFDETSVYPAGPYKYAIELNQGTVEKVGVKAGDVLAIPDAAREP